MKKKGFTLVELLAVIVVLAVIALIVTPTILKVIDNARIGAFRSSSHGIVNAAKQSYLLQQSSEESPNLTEYQYTNGKKIRVRGNIDIDYKGSDPSSGTLLINNDGKVAIALYQDGYCALKTYENGQIKLEKKTKEDCSLPLSEPIFTVLDDAINSVGWANEQFYVQVTYTDEFKWCSTTGDTCVPNKLVDSGIVKVLISENSTTNKICVQNDDEIIKCSPDYKLDNTTSIASNSDNYVAITPGTNINVIDYFTYASASGIESTSCKTNNSEITDTTSLTQGNYDIECSVKSNSGAVKKATINLAVNNCYQFDSNTKTINDYYCYQGNSNGQPTITDLNIPFSINQVAVTTIGTSAFANDKLTSITIPNGIMSIGNNAFQNNQLKELTIPNSVTSINSMAFYKNQLTNVTIPNSITSLGGNVFNYNQLTSVTIPNTIKSIELSTFANNKLTSVVIPDSVTKIGPGAFSTNQLTNVTIPNGVTIIDQNAFQRNQLISVTIPNSVITIGYQAFSSNQLTSVTIPGSVTSIGTSAFYGNQLISVTIGDSVTSIGKEAFSNNQLTSVMLPNSVTTIEPSAFSNNQLASVTIPTSVTSIGDSVFSNNQLTNVTIPNSVTSIGNNPFISNPNARIIVDSNNLNYKSVNGAVYTKDGKILISGNKDMSNNIENTVTNIRDYAFRGNQLTSVTIPTSVTSIGNYAFSGNQLTSVTIPNNGTTIGGYAFYQNKLTSLTIPNSITSIGENAFRNNQLTSLTILSNITSIGVGIFAENKLTNVTIPTSVTTIDGYAFFKNQLTSVTIPQNVTSIGKSAFCKDNPYNYNKINTIVNKTGRSFDWSDITCADQLSQVFVTGTVVHQYGNITVSAS